MDLVYCLLLTLAARCARLVFYQSIKVDCHSVFDEAELIRELQSKVRCRCTCILNLVFLSDIVDSMVS